MKEFQYKKGGRRLYCEDIARLQELALSFNSILAGCEKNFVVSGCKVTRTVNAGYASRLDIKVSAGYVFINGKIREVAETTFTAAPASYVPAIMPSDVTNSSTIAYADGSTGPAYYDYGAVVQSGAVTDFNKDNSVVYDPITLKFPDMKDFIGSYAICYDNEDWLNLKEKGLLRKDIRLDGGEKFRVADYHEVQVGGAVPVDTQFVDIDSEGIVIEKTESVDGESVTNRVSLKNGSLETTGDIKSGGNASVDGDFEAKGTVRAGKIVCDSIIIHEEDKDEDGNKTIRDWYWKWHDFKDVIERYEKLDKEFTELMTVGDGEGATLLNAANINERIKELNGRITKLQQSLEGTDSTDGIVARYEGIIAELRETNENVMARMAEVITQNTQLREDNIAIKTKIDNLQTNYASQLSSIQALNTRVDSLRSASVAQVLTETSPTQQATTEP